MSKRKRNLLPVIFRAERAGPHKGEVSAVFPTIPGTDAYDFTVYTHVGQHSAGTHGWFLATRPAKLPEYEPLLIELEQLYSESTLKVYKRMTAEHTKQRLEAPPEPMPELERVEFKVSFLLPAGASVAEAREYVDDAVRAHCGGLAPGKYEHDGDPMFELDRTSVLVTRARATVGSVRRRGKST